MAKLIQQGTFRKVHPLCGSLVEFKFSELREDYHTDYLGNRDYYRYIICPGCGEQMKFPYLGTPC